VFHVELQYVCVCVLAASGAIHIALPLHATSQRCRLAIFYLVNSKGTILDGDGKITEITEGGGHVGP